MRLQLLLAAGLGSDRGVALAFGELQHHGLVEEGEALDLADGLFGRLERVEDDEGLAFGAQVFLGDDVDYGAVLGEDGLQGGFEEGDGDGFFQVADLERGGG